MKSIGILGGSFDPVHIGHLVTTRHVFEKRNLEKIIIIPNYISPLKKERHLIDPEHRLKMLELAIRPFPFFELSDIEIRHQEISYTYETLAHLKKYYNNLELIIGYDNLLVFDRWHLPEKILDLATLIVMKRSTDSGGEIRNKFFNSAVIIDTPTIEISATDIRARVKQGLPIDYLVPEEVKNYILINHLYE
jgi:nicotinate-nucleotide adenylyltransferase